MCEEWMPGLKFRLSLEEFHRLPRNPAFKYEYWDRLAQLTPRPRHFHGLLELARPEPTPPLSHDLCLRPVQDGDRHDLASLFAASFATIQPFGSLDDELRREAARHCLDKTFTGGDGPMVSWASFVVEEKESQRPNGAILVTLLPDGDPTEPDSYYWNEPPPADCIERRLGRPHVTWVFVSPQRRGDGLGSTLLAAAVHSLHQLGFTQLLSTFLLGNDSSMLWHWRNGFQLLPYPGSKRLRRR